MKINQRSKFHRGVLLALALTSALAACSATPSSPAKPRNSAYSPAEEPGALLAMLASTSTPEESRRTADQRLVQLHGKTDPSRLAVLEQMLYAPGHSDPMRRYALDQLADADAARTGQALILYLPRFEGPVLAYACQLAVRLGDPRVSEALIRSLVGATGSPPNPAALQQRPEWTALEKLSGSPTLEALYGVVEKGVNPSARIAALDILQAALPAADVIARLQKFPGGRGDVWLEDVQWWASQFGTLPVGPNESLWIRQLARREQADLLIRALARHRQLQNQPDYLFSPRFAGILAAIDEPALKMSRQQLLQDLAGKLAAQKHLHREPAYKGAPEDVDESLEAHEKKLTRCDLFAIRLLLDALADPALLAEFQRQGLADLSDTASEHGGLLAFENRQLVPHEYPGMYAGNDFQYVTSDKLLRDTATGLAQYHFHFQQVHNGQRAGPGAGDLQFTRTARCNAVVITSVDTRKMNLDFYTPNGAVVDLGVYEAPP